MLATHIVEVAVNWQSKAWDSWNSWWVAPSVLASFRKLPLCFCLGDERLADLHRFLLVLTCSNWIQVPLLQSIRAVNQDFCFPGRSASNGDYMCFDLVKAIHVTVEVARHGWNRPAPPSTVQDQWEPSLHRSVL